MQTRPEVRLLRKSLIVSLLATASNKLRDTHWLSFVGLNEEKKAKLRITVKEVLWSKKEKGLAGMNNSVVTVREGGVGGGGGGYKGNKW